MGNILIIGNFCFGKPAYNGQTQKSRDYYLELCNYFGAASVSYLDSEKFRKRPISAYFKLRSSLKRADSVVLLLGAHAAKFLVPIVSRCKKKYKYKILWSVVGGSLMFDERSATKLLPYFNDCDAIYFETKTMVEHFKNKGYDNIFYAPVFSERKLNSQFDPERNDGILRFCTYSRVCKDKGITDAINAVKRVNGQGIKCTLDIYGQPTDEYKQELQTVMSGAQDYIHLHDYLRGDNVIDTLSQHDAMIFPTFYDGEGFPIGVIECYLAGVPVIASNWHYNSEIVISDKTGFIFEVGDVDALVGHIDRLLKNRDEGLKMRKAAYEYSKNFIPQMVLKDIFHRIGSTDGCEDKNA